MILKNNTDYRIKLLTALVPFALCLFSLLSCHIYKFKDVSIPPDVKTVKVNFIENRAQYNNPQLSPKLTDKLRQKIVSQTRLSQTNSDNADWEVSGTITNYSVSTSAITGKQEVTNRLTVSVHISLARKKEEKTDEYDITRSFEFSANKSLQEAEAALSDEMVRTLTDDIFNRLFSNW
jgi:hypothetical protein